MAISIRLSKKDDVKAYSDFLQPIYEEFYPSKKLGLGKEHFSKEIFATDREQSYLISNLEVNNKQKTWLAFEGKELIGSITITDEGKECELKGFYVATKYQGKGLGKRLWLKALSFAGRKEIFLYLYAHNTKAIKIYKKIGFKIDKQMGSFDLHWEEWPEGLSAKCIYMRLSASFPNSSKMQKGRRLQSRQKD